MAKLFSLAPDVKLALASSSPRRKELLESLGLDFYVFEPIDAEPYPTEGVEPEYFARKAAFAKGQSCLMHIPAAQKCLILSADTVVSLDGKIFGKPKNSGDALRMLLALNGRSHEVYTAFCLHYQESQYCACVHSQVYFGKWPEAILDAYAQSPEPLDKAGAYAVQGEGAFLIEKIRGSWTNVMGLPLAELAQALLAQGFIAPPVK